MSNLTEIDILHVSPLQNEKFTLILGCPVGEGATKCVVEPAQRSNVMGFRISFYRDQKEITMPFYTGLFYDNNITFADMKEFDKRSDRYASYSVATIELRVGDAGKGLKAKFGFCEPRSTEPKNVRFVDSARGAPSGL